MPEDSNIQINTKGKFLFLALSTISLIILMLITSLLWWFIRPSFTIEYELVARSILWTLRIFYIFVLVGILFLFMECYTRFSNKLFLKIIRFSIIFLFPFINILGKCCYISKDSIRESFVKVNNSFVNKTKNKYNARDVLILLPHCLQNYNCQLRVTNKIDICQECNNCVITEFKKIYKEYKVNISIATGGTLARRIIINLKPKLIVAVACQRDLVDGLLDVFPIPVYGILNLRPEGPCINTSVNINEIKNFLDHFINKE